VAPEALITCAHLLYSVCRNFAKTSRELPTCNAAAVFHALFHVGALHDFDGLAVQQIEDFG